MNDLLSSAEAARLADASPWSVWWWHTNGIGGVKLPARVVGGRLVIRRPALSRFLRRVGREPVTAA
jgi:hypothetical protein